MADRTYNVLFLCTGNSARSIMAESILRKDGAGHFNAFSAGSHPKPQVNPFALKVLESYDYPIDGLRTKSWEEFAVPGASLVVGYDIEKERAFVQAFKYLRNRISVFLSLPLASIERLALEKRLREIGRLEGATDRSKAGRPMSPPGLTIAP
jgi:arsenate reductase